MFTVRPAVPEDARAIVELHRASVRGLAAGSYSPEIIEDWVRASDGRVSDLAVRLRKHIEESVVVFDQEDRMAGFGSIVPSLHLLGAVYVLPEFVRMGVGRRVLEHLERRALDFGLTELHMDASVNAEKFYLALGYVSDGSSTHRMGSGAMACVKMHKVLLPGG